MTDPDTMQAILRSLGITITNEDVERLGPSLRAVLTDLQKLDQVPGELAAPTPGFVVEVSDDRH